MRQSKDGWNRLHFAGGGLICCASSSNEQWLSGHIPLPRTINSNDRHSAPPSRAGTHRPFLSRLKRFSAEYRNLTVRRIFATRPVRFATFIDASINLFPPHMPVFKIGLFQRRLSGFFYFFDALRPFTACTSALALCL